MVPDSAHAYTHNASIFTHQMVTRNVLRTVDLKGAMILVSGLDLEHLVLGGGPLGTMRATFNYVT